MNKPRRNRLLSRLLRLEPSLAARVAEASHDLGHEHVRPGAIATDLLFPSGGVLSMLVRTKAGQQVEVNAIGLEGLVGLHGMLGIKRSPFLVLQQVAGSVAQLPMSAVRGLFAARSDARDLIERYTAYQLTTSHLFVACNALHSARTRAARWILMTADQAASDEYPLTQEMLAQMLGVSRQFLSEVAYEFKAAGLIDYRRGYMKILRRGMLEREACECYALINKEYVDTVGN